MSADDPTCTRIELGGMRLAGEVVTVGVSVVEVLKVVGVV
jgi:hypothetical protein